MKNDRAFLLVNHLSNLQTEWLDIQRENNLHFFETDLNFPKFNHKQIQAALLKIDQLLQQVNISNANNTNSE